jgi:hypothetical protein
MLQRVNYDLAQALAISRLNSISLVRVDTCLILHNYLFTLFAPSTPTPHSLLPTPYSLLPTP